MPQNQFDSKQLHDIRQLLSKSGKIAAIKYLRRLRNCSLLEAKQLVQLVQNSSFDTQLTTNSGVLSLWMNLMPREHSEEWKYTTDNHRDVQPPAARPIPRLAIGAGLLILSGLSLLAVSSWLWWRNESIVQSGSVVQAVVTDLDGRTPVLEYEWRGQTHQWKSYLRFENRGGSNKPFPYEVGQELTVFVDESMGTIVVDDFSHRWGVIIILAALGGGLLLTTLVSCLAIMHLSVRFPVGE